MSILAISDPPNPNTQVYIQNPHLYNIAMYKWACALKSQIQQQNRTLSRPTSQNFSVSGYTTSTTLTGTSTGSDVANFLCSLVSSLKTKGVVSTYPLNQ